VNLGARKVKAVPASYKTPIVLLIFIVKSGLVVDRAKIHCHLIYGYFVTVNQIVIATLDFLLAMTLTQAQRSLA
jgi:hypothetical protein